MKSKGAAGKMKVIIVGGVAGGASCAARLRRLNEDAEIILVERGPYVSFANCGLPYHVGGIIEEESELIVTDKEMLHDRFAIDVRTHCEAISISPGRKTVEIRCQKTNKVITESYDKLVLSPGAAPIRPPLPGIGLDGIFTIRTVPDARRIRAWIQERNAGRAVVVGGGFIGLEMAENLVRSGLEVTVVEMIDQVLPPLDPEMARIVEKHLESNGVRLALSDGVAGFRQSDTGSLEVLTGSGASYPADLVVLGIGVRPEVSLAKEAGLEIGERGGIRVDEHMRTSDPDIFAVGDSVEVKDFVTGQWSLMALAGPANRQGRIAADVITGRDSSFRGSQGTWVCGLFGLGVAATGASEKLLNRLGDKDFEKAYIYPMSHAGYYPGAKMLTTKILFRKSGGRVLGAEIVGEDGAEKRVDAIAMAIQMGATVYDLEEAELCYAPQFGNAKSPVNFAGMVAANILHGDMPVSHWDSEETGFLLDVRNPIEFSDSDPEGALNIPINELRSRLDELPRDREILVYCYSGVRSYYATRILIQNGFRVRNISGGILAWDMTRKP